MFGLRNLNRLRWYFATLCIVLPALTASVASADKVTICHFPPGNPSKFVQITIDSAGLSDHLAHGDFVGTCAHDCNLNPGLCSTAPDACHTAAGTCSKTTGLCQFPNQPDGTACVGTVGLGCDQCVNGACAAAADCNLQLGESCTSVGYCDTSTHTCQQAPLAACPPTPVTGVCSSDGITLCSVAHQTADCGVGNTCNELFPGASSKCFSTGCDSAIAECVQFCMHPPCATPGQPGCGDVLGCISDADCPSTDACSIGSCFQHTCHWNAPSCNDGDPNTVDICDPQAGCEHFPNPFVGVDCPSYFNPLPLGLAGTDNEITFTDSIGAEVTVLAQNSNSDCSSVPNLPSDLIVTSCGFSPNGCNQLQNNSTAAVTATDASGNQFPIQPGAIAMICNSVPLVPSGATVACSGCCTYTNTTNAAAPIQFSDANGISYLLSGGQEALVCDSVPSIPTGIGQSCPPLP